MEKNSCISCSVQECKYHSNSVDYCTLEKIHVGKCVGDTCSVRDTECGSFEAK